MSRPHHADVLVIGGGTMGTAAGWALARRGHSVIVLEQFGHIHSMGSHSGNTRIFRHAYFEGPTYVPWTLDADAAWVGLQERSGTQLMIRCGCLDMGAPSSEHAARARQSAELYALPHDDLTGAEVNDRFRAWNVPEDWDACFDPEAGILFTRPCLQAMADELRTAGGAIVDNCKVTGWSADNGTVTVSTDGTTFSADRLIITAGPWATKLMRDLNLPLTVERKPVMWFNADDPSLYTPDVFPAFIVNDGSGEYYGLPAAGYDPLKMGIHHRDEQADPDTLDREFRDADLTPRFRQFIAACLPGVSFDLAATSMCMYTMTPDEDFLIDRHPEYANVAYAAGFSGHGFKFAPTVGDYLADLATTDHDVRPEFALARFATSGVSPG